MQDANIKNKCFVVFSNELEKRLDVPFYRPDLVEIVNKIKSRKKNYIRFGEIIEEMSGGATPKIEGDFYTDKDEGVPFLRVQNITEEGIELVDVKYIKREVHNGALKRSQLQSYDLVFTITGRIGSASIVPLDFEGNINQHSVRIKLKNVYKGEGVNPYYVAAFFNTSMGRKISMRYITGGTRPALDYKAIKELPFLLPSLDIQNEAARFFDKAYKKKREFGTLGEMILNSLDSDVLEGLGIKIKKLEDKMCFSVSSDKIEERRVDPYYFQPKFNNLEDLLKESNLTIIKFGDIIKKVINGLDCRDFSEKGLTYLRVSNIKANKIDLKGCKYINPEGNNKDIALKKGNILLTRKGTFGVAVCAEKDLDYIISSEIFRIEIDEKEVDPAYLAVLLNSSICQIQFDREKIGAIMGSLSQDAIKNILLPIPNLKRQWEIVKGVKEKIRRGEEYKLGAKYHLEGGKKDVESVILSHNR